MGHLVLVEPLHHPRVPLAPHGVDEPEDRDGLRVTRRHFGYGNFGEVRKSSVGRQEGPGPTDSAGTVDDEFGSVHIFRTLLTRAGMRKTDELRYGAGVVRNSVVWPNPKLKVNNFPELVRVLSGNLEQSLGEIFFVSDLLHLDLERREGGLSLAIVRIVT